MNKKIFLILISSSFTLFHSLAFSKDGPIVPKKWEENACASIKRVTHAHAGTCAMASWDPLGYALEYKLSGIYEQSSPIHAFSKSDLLNPNDEIRVMEWLDKRGSYGISGKTECRLDTPSAKWSCSTTLAPFRVIVEQIVCSCETGGFAGCGLSLQCSPALTTSEDGVTLIDPKEISEAVEKTAR